MARHTLDPKLDLVFKMLFGAPENRDLLRSLLEAVLRPPSPIVAIEVLRSDPPAEGFEDKGIALDLRVRLQGGEQVDVEMQTRPRPAQRERALFYWARLYGGQLARGESYSKLKRCVVIMIHDFRELGSRRFHSVFQVREVHDQGQFSDQLEIHWLELPNLKLDPATNDEPALVGWGKFLSASTDEELDHLAMANPVLERAKEALDRLSADREARELAEQREIALFMHAVDLTEAEEQGRAKGRTEGREQGRTEGREQGRTEGREQGRTEGREQGRTEGRVEFLLDLLESKFGEVPEGARARVTGGTEAELKRWGQNILSARSLDEVFGATKCSPGQ